ncbi:MAG: ArsR/SmtB family transcription factor [Planctomycetota bacterium]
MGEPSQELTLSRLFRIMGNPIALKLLECLGNRKYTLPGLVKRLKKSKPLICMYLSVLYKGGLIDKAIEKGKMRYWLKERGLKAVIKHGRKFLTGLYNRPPSLS